MEQPRWQPTSHDEYEELVGRDVYTHDGERIGRVERIIHPASQEMEDAHLGHFVVIRPDFLGGPLGTDAAYVPETAVALATPDAVELTVDVGDVPNQSWARLPVDLDPRPAPLPDDVPPAPEGGWYEEGHRAAD
jgi:hypothetical protein